MTGPSGSPAATFHGTSGADGAPPHRIERGWVEVRRRTRPRVGFVNLESIDRIISAIFHGYHERQEGRNRTLRLFTHGA